MNLTDIFNDDAFSLTSMVAAINDVDHVPGRAGALAFAGSGEGVPNLSVIIESKGEALTLIPTTPRGAPAPKEKRDKARLESILIPQIKLEETIMAHSIQGVRQFGTTDQLAGVQTVVNQQLAKMARRHDLTLEFHRLGALKGQILDADGSVLVDLHEKFYGQNVAASELTVEFDLDDVSATAEAVRISCHSVVRQMKRNAKTVIPNSAKVWAFCGDEFFDKLVEHPSVKEAYKGYEKAEQRLGANYAFGIFEFGGIFFENYQGTDDGGDSDGGTVGIAPDECRFFLTGVPGLYAEYYAPADFMETVNTVGLPRYAKAAPDNRFNQFVEIHTQQNPLPLCLRPKTLMRGTIA